MDFENFDLWCWLVPVIIGILCGIFGYFIGRGGSKTQQLNGQLEEMEAQNRELQSKLDDCKRLLSERSEAPPTNDIPFDADAAKAAFGQWVKKDDLKIVEGIGPKIEGLFHNYDIKTWKALSRLSVAKCREVLESGGEKYRVHDPASWPMQAKMCYQNKWKELYKWQQQHLHGKL